MSKKVLISSAIYAVPVLFVVGLIAWVALAPQGGNGTQPSRATEDVLAACINHGGISMHIHPELKIYFDGAAQEIPANIGIDGACMHPVHTHDNTGKIHLEYPVQKDFTLGDFFTTWKQSFNKDEVMGMKADATHRIRMVVNGQESSEYENFVMHDLDRIEIHYETIPTE